MYRSLLMSLFVVSGLTAFDAEAGKILERGIETKKNFRFEQNDCRETLIAKSDSDLTQFSRNKNLIIDGNLSSDIIRIESDCEVKLMPHSSLTADKELVLFVKDLKLGAKTRLSSADIYIKAEKDLRFTAGTEINSKRLLIQVEIDLEIRNPSNIDSKIVIFNARNCNIHKDAKFIFEEKLGSCFGLPEILLKLNVNPIGGNYPLPVTFDDSESFGIIDQFEYDFGNESSHLSSMSKVTYTYEKEGKYLASVGVQGGFLRYDGFILLHLFASGSISNGGVAKQNGWIAGSIRDGGYAQFYGTTYWHSGINWGATIGSNGQANCYSYVANGTLNKSICHQVYDGSRDPDTMNIDDWIAGKPWPNP